MLDAVVWSADVYTPTQLMASRCIYYNPMLVKARNGVYSHYSGTMDVSQGEVLLLHKLECKHFVAKNKNGLHTMISPEYDYTFEVFRRDRTKLGVYSLFDIHELFIPPVLVQFDSTKKVEFDINDKSYSSSEIGLFELTPVYVDFIKASIIDERGVVHGEEILRMDTDIKFIVATGMVGMPPNEFSTKLHELSQQTVRPLKRTNAKTAGARMRHKPLCAVKPFSHPPEPPMEDTSTKEDGTESSKLEVVTPDGWPTSVTNHTSVYDDTECLYDNHMQIMSLLSSSNSTSDLVSDGCNAADPSPHGLLTRCSPAIDQSKSAPAQRSKGSGDSRDNDIPCRLIRNQLGPFGIFNDHTYLNLEEMASAIEEILSGEAAGCEISALPEGSGSEAARDRITRPADQRAIIYRAAASKRDTIFPPPRSQCRKRSDLSTTNSGVSDTTITTNNDITTATTAMTATTTTTTTTTTTPTTNPRNRNSTHTIHSLDQVPRDISALGISEVSDCLILLKLEWLVDPFAAEQMDGVLLRACTSVELMEKFGIGAVTANKVALFAQGAFRAKP